MASLRRLRGVWFCLAAWCLLPTVDCLRLCVCVADDGIKERRVFVPLEDLEAIITKDHRGVLLPRDEFLKLYREAQKHAPTTPTAPVGAVISGATYSATFAGEQLVVQATIRIHQLADTWQAVPLLLSGLAVENGKLDGQPAKLGRTDQSLVLLSDQRGEHTLTLELSVPLTAVGADKVASVGVLPGVPGTLKIAVPAGKHLRIDGLSVERPAANDQPAMYELAVGGKRKAVAIQLTDRQRERTTDALLFATTGFGVRVAPGEITWHAVTALQVHGTPLDRLVCVVPKTLEITDVDSSGLEAWELSDDPHDASATRITLNYRQPFDGSRQIDFHGVISVPAGESWRVPTLKISQVTSHIGRALVQHAPSVRLRTVESVGVRTATIRDADLKAFGTIDATDPGRVTLLFDVWREEFSLGFVAQPKEQDVQASLSSIFDLTAHGLDLITAATVETSFAPLFELEASLSAEWLLTSVTVNGQTLPWQVRTKEDEPGVNHIRIALPQPLRPGQTAKLEVRAHRDLDGWPVEDQPVDVMLPELRLPQSSVTEGTYVIKADSDLDVVPGDITGLDPANVPVPGARLGFTYQDTRFSGTLRIERKPSRVAARTLTLARLDRQTLHTHFETELTISGGGLRVLDVALAEAAGKDLRFHLLNAPARIVEQTSRSGENGERIWTLRLDRHFVGTATLVVTSVSSRGSAPSPLTLGEGGRRPGEGNERSTSATTTAQTDANAKGTNNNVSQTQSGSLVPALSQREREKNAPITLPHLRLLAADRQNGFIAIEAEGDQRLTITAQDGHKANLPEVDPIDLPVPLAYRPNQRIVAAYRYFAGAPTITIADERFDRLPVPTAICREAKIVSVLSPAGEFQHQATFAFTAVGVQSLRVKFDSATSPLPLGEGGRRPGEGSEQLTTTSGAGNNGQMTSASLAPALFQREKEAGKPLSTDLWAALVDGQPVEVRRAEGAFLIPLRPTNPPTAERTLQLFYRTTVPALRRRGALRQPPPELTVVNGAGVSQPMQMLDQHWELRYPPDLLLTDSQGVFVPDATTPLDRTNWLSNLPKSLSLPSRANSTRMVIAILGVLVLIGLIWVAFRRSVIAASVLLIGCVVVIAVVAPATQSAREAARRMKMMQDMQKTPTASSWFAGEMPVMGGTDLPVTAPTAQSMTAEAMPEDRTPLPAARRELTDRKDEVANARAEARTKFVPRVGGFAAEFDEVPISDPRRGYTAEELKARRSLSGADLSRSSGRPLPPQIAKMPQSHEKTNEVSDDVLTVQRQDLSLDVRQSQRSPADARRGGGWLSLTMALETQDGTATKKFRYLGTQSAGSGIGLDLVYENRAAGWTGRGVWIAGLAFLAWLLPPNRRKLKATWVALGLTLPLALAAMAPQSWQNTLDGVFFGTVAAIALWGIRALGESLSRAWPRMKTKAFWTRSLTKGAASVCLAAFVVADSAVAQPPQVAQPAVAPVNPNPDIPARPTIIFPYDNPKEPLAAERVYLPHAKFVELWNAAHPELAKKPPAPLPGEVAEALFVVAPKERPKGDDTAIAEVRGRVTLFTGKPMWVPIPLKNGVLTETMLDDRPAATQVFDVKGESRVAVYLPDAGLHVLDLAAELPIQQAGPTGQLTLQLAPVPAGKLLFVNSGEDIAFRVNGATNTFRVRQGAAVNNPREAESKPGAEPLSNAASLLQRTVLGQGAKETYYEVAINAGGELRLAWQPKQAAGAVDAIVQADSQTAVQVEDAGVRIGSNWQLKVPRGAINDVSFSLPKELKVRSISGPDVGGWELGENVAGRVLRVFLRRAVADQTSLAFELFLETHVADEAVSIHVPAFVPLQVTRDFGVIGLFAAPQFVVKNIATKGLTQINANLFVVPPSGGAAKPPEGGTTNSAPLSVFRYTARPFEIRFSAQRRSPESTGFAEHALMVDRRKIRMSSRLRWDLAGALRSSVGVQLPAGWLPIDVDATSLQDWHIDPTTNVLTVEFTEPRLGAVEVVLLGNVPKEPEDAIAEISVPVPLETSKLTTQAAVWFDPAYEASVNLANGWKSADPEHCSEELRTKLGRPARFLFTSNATPPEVLGFDLVRAVPQLSADAVTLVTVSDTAVDYSLALQWKIDGAAADTFTFTTPDWLAGKLDFQGAGIRQTRFAPVGGDSQRTRWTITLQDPVGTRYFLLATATLPPPEKRDIVAPTISFERRVAAEGAAGGAPGEDPQASPFVRLDKQRQYVVAINISSHQLVTVDAAGETVPRDELPIVVNQQLIDQATAVLRISGQEAGAGGQPAQVAAPKWSLKSFTAQAGAPASVNLADLTTVLAADGTWRMQCVYTIKNRSRQFLALQLPEQALVLSVFVGNQPSRLVERLKDGKTYQLVALPKTSEADLSFQVKLVLSGRLASGALPRGLRAWGQEFDVPAPTVVSLSDDKEYGIPVARTLWAVHVPRDWTAKPLNDPVKNNLTEQAGDTSAIAYQAAWLQEANELMRIIEGNHPVSQKLQARNNLKQLGLALHNYTARADRGLSALPPSDEGRKVAQSLQEFEAKQAELESRIIIDSSEGGLNFYVAKDQQQAAQARAAQQDPRQSMNVLPFFSQSGQQGSGFQRQIVTQTNRELFLGNSAVVADSEDVNGNGVLDPGEDVNNNGVLDRWDVGGDAPATSLSTADGAVKFKLNVTDEKRKPESAWKGGDKREEEGRSLRSQFAAGKNVTEVDRALRRKQAVEQLDQLNQAVDREKQAQQQAQLTQRQLETNVAAQPPRSGATSSPAVPVPPVGALNQESASTGQPGDTRNHGRFGMAFGGRGGQMGGGGFGGGVPGSNAPPSASEVAVDEAQSTGLVLESLPRHQVGVPGWTQAGGLSLPIEVPREGNVLRFSRASGSPRLALTVRPNESDTLGLGVVWAGVWSAIGIWLLRVLAGSSNRSAWRQVWLGLTGLGLLGMFVLPSPLSEGSFAVFALVAIGLSIGLLRTRRQNVAL